ncbi:MAG: HEAT repeat domain-containing protein, partial [Kiritimatiellales bacterium]
MSTKRFLQTMGQGLLICMALWTWEASALKVGLFKDKGSVALNELSKALNAAGHETDTFGAADASEGRIYDYDVLFFGGGWNSYDWLDLNARMQVVEFVRNRGGGAIFSMFRCGWAGRSGIRPLFPEIAWADNKVNLEGIGITLTNHPVVLGLPPEFNTPATDHAVLRLGPEGEVLARNTNGDIVIACGQAGKGRVVFLGPWIGLDQDQNTPYPMPAIDEKLLLNSIGWVTAPAAKVAGTETNVSEEVKSRVLRREKIMDWTHDEERLTIFTGILTEAFDLSEEALDSLQIRADRLAPFADAQSSQRLSDARKNIERLRAKIAREYAQAKQKKIDAIAKMSITELEKEPVRDLSIRRNKAALESYKKQMEAFREQFLPASALAPVEREVASIEEALAPKIMDAERRKAAEEKERDAKAAPGLIEALKSPEAFAREEAAMELGRMGNRQAIPALVKALEDKEYPVRRNAIYALGWMQAQEAVPALLALAEKTQDIRVKRRVAEALGLIGDVRAVDFLVQALKNPDRFVRQNVIISLGWLGSMQAIGALVKILEAPLDEIGMVNAPTYKQDTENGWTMEDVVCAAQALGHIGDTNAVPALEECRRKHKKEKEKPSLYFTSMKMEDAVETALKEIEQGGRKERGVRQAEFLSLRDNFYWLPRKYNAFYGRLFAYDRLPKDWKIAADYAA